MKTVELKPVEHNRKIGDSCPDIEPNITEDTLFVANGKAVGFYLSSLPKDLDQLLSFANNELQSDRVPKSKMIRSNGVPQYSCILGSIPKNDFRRNPKNSSSSVHQCKTAFDFIKAMVILGRKTKSLIRDVDEGLYLSQKKHVQDAVDRGWLFGDFFTSNINNCNISADFHIDRANIKHTVNAIYYKKRYATGGHTHLPGYNATPNACDGGLLVYPAWRDMHGVTPIKKTAPDGYRNSLVFYPLKAFLRK